MVLTWLNAGALHPTRSKGSTKEPADPPNESEGRFEADTVACACTHALAIVLCKHRLSHAAFTHAILARLIATKDGSQPANAKRADTDRPDKGPIVRAVDRRKSFMVDNLGMATAETCKAAGCRPVRKIWAPSRYRACAHQA